MKGSFWVLGLAPLVVVGGCNRAAQQTNVDAAGVDDVAVDLSFSGMDVLSPDASLDNSRDGIVSDLVEAGSACVGSMCPVVLIDQQYPFAMAIDASRLYWIDALGRYTLKAIPLSGGSPQIVAEAGLPEGLVIRGGNAFWTTSTNVMKAAIDGASAAVSLTTNNTGNAEPFAVDDSNVYFVSSSSKVIMKVSVSGGPATMLATNTDEVLSLTSDGTSLYWTCLDSRIRKIPVGGGTPVVLADNQSNSHGLLQDGTSLYWAALGTSTIAKMPLGGGRTRRPGDRDAHNECAALGCRRNPFVLV